MIPGANETIEPQKILILYRPTPSYKGDTRPGITYVEERAVRQGEVCEGRPLSKETLISICRQVYLSNANIELLPANILLFNEYHRLMMWWTPAKIRSMFFTKNTGIKTGLAPTPATLFLVSNSKLHVWALDNNERPTPKTVIYSSPYYNVMETGTCMGNMSVPDSTEINDIHMWENLFFKSNFTLAGEPKLKGIKAKALWNNLIKYKKKRFPVTTLIRATTLQNLIDEIKGKNKNE